MFVLQMSSSKSFGSLIKLFVSVLEDDSTLHMQRVSAVRELYLNGTWTVPEPYLSRTWTIPELYLNRTWTVPEPYLNCTWTIPEPHLNYTRTIPEPYLSRTYFLSNRTPLVIRFYTLAVRCAGPTATLPPRIRWRGHRCLVCFCCRGIWCGNVYE